MLTVTQFAGQGHASAPNSAALSTILTSTSLAPAAAAANIVAALNSRCRYVRIGSTVDARVAFGGVADVNSMPVFAGREIVIAVNGSTSISIKTI